MTPEYRYAYIVPYYEQKYKEEFKLRAKRRAETETEEHRTDKPKKSRLEDPMFNHHILDCIPSSRDKTIFCRLLNYAISSKNNDVRTAMKDGAQTEIKFKLLQTYLDVLCWIDDLTMLEKLVSYIKFLNLQDEGGKTLLYYAVQANNVNLVKVLLKKGATLDIPINKSNETVLHMACQKTDIHLDMIKVFNEHGANFDVECDTGCTPFFQALSIARHEVVLYILTHCKPSITPRFEKGPSALHYAASNKHVDIVDALIDLGLDVNLKALENKKHLLIKSPAMFSPLCHASRKKRAEVYEYLIYSGANYDSVEQDDTWSFRNYKVLDTYTKYYRSCRVELIEMGNIKIAKGLSLLDLVSCTVEKFVKHYDAQKLDLIEVLDQYESIYSFFIPYFKNTVLRGVQKEFRKRRAATLISHLLEVNLNYSSLHIAKMIVKNMTPVDLIYFNDPKCMEIIFPKNKEDDEAAHCKVAESTTNTANTLNKLPDYIKKLIPNRY